jgi:hypothetical protein
VRQQLGGVDDLRPDRFQGIALDLVIDVVRDRLECERRKTAPSGSTADARHGSRRRVADNTIVVAV